MTNLEPQIQFLLEADRLKTILRQTLISDASRRENSAEHSWHFALAVMVLQEHAPPELNLTRVLQMALVHDLVEIDAGDTFVYDTAAVALRVAKEQLAADRIFQLLPGQQGAHFRALWDEFEAGETLEARFAAALDRLCPILLNVTTRGDAWNRHGVTATKVRARNLPAMVEFPALHAYVSALIDSAVSRGFLPE